LFLVFVFDLLIIMLLQIQHFVNPAFAFPALLYGIQKIIQLTRDYAISHVRAAFRAGHPPGSLL